MTLLCLHYWAGSGRAFAALRPHLPADTRLLAPDLPGFGQQAAPAGFDYSVAAYTDWVADYLARNQVADFTLLGHSMGGKIALALASRRPAGLQRLVLLAPSPPPGEPMSADDRAQALAAFGQSEAAHRTAQKITQRPLPPPAFEQVVADNLATARPAWDHWLLTASQENIAPLLTGLVLPCALLVGSADRAIAPAVQAKCTLPHLPPGTRLTPVPGAGHLLPLEAPAAVAAAVLEWLE